VTVADRNLNQKSDATIAERFVFGRGMMDNAARDAEIM
jgi:hypothetical protein